MEIAHLFAACAAVVFNMTFRYFTEISLIPGDQHTLTAVHKKLLLPKEADKGGSVLSPRAE